MTYVLGEHRHRCLGLYTALNPLSQTREIGVVLLFSLRRVDVR